MLNEQILKGINVIKIPIQDLKPSLVDELKECSLLIKEEGTNYIISY